MVSGYLELHGITHSLRCKFCMIVQCLNQLYLNDILCLYWCCLVFVGDVVLHKKIKTQAPHISADVIHAQYTVETLVMAVIAGAIFALLVGFLTGYFCGRRCHKDDDDNLPYPDTEYEYFEQRQNMNRLEL